MSLSGPFDQASELRWMRWQARGTRRDKRGAAWRRLVLTTLVLVIGALLVVTIRARRAEGTPTGLLLAAPAPTQ